MPDRRRAQPVVANRLQRRAERRVHQPARDEGKITNSTPGSRTPRCARQIEIERARAPRSITTPCKPSAPPVSQSQPVGELEQDQPDPERDHEPRQVEAAQDVATLVHEPSTVAVTIATARPTSGSRMDVLGEQRRRIGAHAEERGVTERDDAGVAQHQIEREREQRHDGDLVEQRRSARRHKGPRRQSQIHSSTRRHAMSRRRRGQPRTLMRRGRPASRHTPSRRPAREQALRPDDQHRDHDAVDDEGARVRDVVLARHVGDAEEQRRQQRAR